MKRSSGAGSPEQDAPMPVFDLRAHDAPIAAEIEAAVRETLSSGWFILGRQGELFEQAFAAWLGGGRVTGVGSGTDALTLALKAAGVGAGDSVITVPNTAVPTVNAISAVGATPAFVDVDPATALLDPARLAAALRPTTRAVIPVHLYGRAVPMEPILDFARLHGLAVIEDAAQAHGAASGGRRAGTWGDFGCFSFYPSKNLGAYGDAGAIWTADPARAELLRRLRNYGQTDRYVHDTIGVNSRLDELQAAILLAKLPHLAGWNARRIALAASYARLLAGLPLVTPAPATDGSHVYHLFTVRVRNRDRVRDELGRLGIGTQIHYPLPVHLQNAYRFLGHGPGDFPAAEAWCAETLSLPFSPVLGENDAQRVARALETALRAAGS